MSTPSLSVRLQGLFRSEPGTLAGWLLIAMPLLALPVRCYMIWHALYAKDGSVFDVGFGFGDYTRGLLESGQFRSCTNLPFKACHPAICTMAARMPAIPLLYALLASWLGTQAAPIAIAKCCLLALGAAAFLWIASRDLRVSRAGIVVLYVLYFGVQPLKHGSTLEYEEGVLIDLSLCLAIAVIYILRTDLATSKRRRTSLAVAAVLIATLMYFTKTTALLTLVVVAAMVAATRCIDWRAKLACGLIILFPFAVWVNHNDDGSHRIHLSSSWNGENLFRGYNSGAAAIYPEINLDRAFDSRKAILDSGQVVALGDFTDSKCFDDEWAWNDYYSSQARNWASTHAFEALRLNLEKIWVALFEIRETPKYMSATDKTPLYPPAVRVALIGWMIYARTIFFVTLAASLAAFRQPSRRGCLWIPVLLGAASAPYMLVFGWQRHIVPVLVMAGTLYVGVFLSMPRTQQCR